MTAPGTQLGVVAAGHPVSAGAGADALRDGGNAVDAALGAMLASFACEPLLTGLGAGGYMLVVSPGREAADAAGLLRRGARPRGRPRARSELIPVRVSFGDAVQMFNVGAASVGTFGMPAGVCEAARRFGRFPLDRLVAPAARLAREGVELNAQQAYIIEILGGIVTSTPEAAALFAPDGRAAARGRDAAPARARRRAGAARAPRARGRSTRATSPPRSSTGWPSAAGWSPRRICRVRGGRPRAACASATAAATVLTNPPPSAGGHPDRPRAGHAGRGARPARRSSSWWR